MHPSGITEDRWNDIGLRTRMAEAERSGFKLRWRAKRYFAPSNRQPSGRRHITVYDASSGGNAVAGPVTNSATGGAWSTSGCGTLLPTV